MILILLEMFSFLNFVSKSESQVVPSHIYAIVKGGILTIYSETKITMVLRDSFQTVISKMRTQKDSKRDNLQGNEWFELKARIVS